MYLAEYMARRGYDVHIVEKEADFMQRASYTNQARVHNGYHYPRSILTAMRSRISFPRFVDEFRTCISADFDKYYLIGKVLGKVTALQFEQFCRRIGAPCEPAPSSITRWANRSLVESAYQTTEYAFDSSKLKQLMTERLLDARVRMLPGTQVTRIDQGSHGLLTATLQTGDDPPFVLNGLTHVFNCTYSMINALNARSGLAVIPLKHEMTEMCLIDLPSELKGCGVTVMCGPFFSFMPFPARGRHSFSHVRYTPHHEWHDAEASPYVDAHEHHRRSSKDSAWPSMWRDAARYMPILESARYIESLWEVKTVLPRSESDDSRPILFKSNHGLAGYHCIMGGKIDNVYDVVTEIERSNLVG